MKTVYPPNSFNGQIAQLLDLARDHPAALYFVGVAGLLAITYYLSHR